MSCPSRKYLSTTEMVNGYRKKTNTPIPNLCTIPGDFRVYRPTKNDVLCGRGKPIQDHPGNLRMRRIVAKFTDRYMNARKHNKQEIVENVVEVVKNSGGVLTRFLKRVGRENYWVEVPKSVACDKVSHALRCLVRKAEAGESMDFLDDSSSISSNDDASHSDRDDGNGSSSSSLCSSVPSLVSPQQANSLATGIKELQKHNPLLSLPPFSKLPGANVLDQILKNSALPAAPVAAKTFNHLSEKSLVELLLQQRVAQQLLAAKQREEDQKASIVQKLLKDVFLLDQQGQEQKRRQENEAASKLTLALLAVAAAGR